MGEASMDRIDVRVASPAAMTRLLAVARAHPYVVIFGVALAARIVASVAVFVVFGGSLVLDDATYSDMAAQAAEGRVTTWDPYVHWLYQRTALLLWPLTWLYRVTGSTILAGQLFVAVFGAMTAVVAARLAAEVMDRRGVWTVGLLIALLPSQVLFSSLVLKDAQSWMILSLIALLVAIAARVSRGRMLAAVVLIAGLLFLLGYVRLHTAAVASVALALTSWVGGAQDRLLRCASLIAVAVVIPVLLGIGPLGLSVAGGYANQLESIRAAQATGGSAIAAAKPPAQTADDPAEPEAAAPAPVEEDQSAAAVNLRYLPIGAASVLFEPTPWRTSGSAAFRLAQAENLLWYPLLAAAVVGFVLVVRRRSVLLYPVVVGGGVLIMWALVEGNTGTAYRHRGELVWVVCLLAAVGLTQLPFRWTPSLAASHTTEEPTTG